jgi:ribosomal protein S13
MRSLERKMRNIEEILSLNVSVDNVTESANEKIVEMNASMNEKLSQVTEGVNQKLREKLAEKRSVGDKLRKELEENTKEIPNYQGVNLI